MCICVFVDVIGRYTMIYQRKMRARGNSFMKHAKGDMLLGNIVVTTILKSTELL